VITDWRTYFGDDGAGLAGALRIWDGGLGIWGAVALGGVGAWIGCRQKGIPLPAFGDAIVAAKHGLDLSGMSRRHLIVVTDGESNWVEGLQLLSVYLIVALRCYWIGPNNY